MTFYIQSGVATELQELLDKNPEFTFTIRRWSRPNGWMIFGQKRTPSTIGRWYEWLASSNHQAFMCPPYEIETQDEVMARVLYDSLENTKFNVTLVRI